MIVNREDVISTLQQALQHQDGVLAVWEAGSKATNALDEYSDLDVMVLCLNEKKESILQQTKAVLEQTYHVLEFHRIKEPAWHGFSQFFMQIQDTPPYFYLDIAFLPESAPDYFLDPLRHGHAHALFDPKHLVQPTPDSIEISVERANRVYQQANTLDFVFRNEIMKAMKREFYPDAVVTYYQWLNRHVISYLNLMYRRAKCDFGIRYIQKDYPKDVWQRIEKAYRVQNVQEIENQYQAINVWLKPIKDTIDKEFQKG